MNTAQTIKEHMEVLGSDGQHVGTVDHIEGKDKIKLTKTDAKAGGKHHLIPMNWVDRQPCPSEQVVQGRDGPVAGRGLTLIGA
jgi:hypothetical protein